MTNKNYSVVFRGDIVIGKSLPEVKQKLKQIFKVDDARIDSLFVGKPISLKTNLSEQEAEKYQVILQQAGIVVAVESADKKISKPKKIDKKEAIDKKETTPVPSDQEEWGLAPVGSLLQDKKTQQTKEIDVNVDHLSVLPQEGNLLKDDERQAAPDAEVNADALDWDLTPYGEALLKEAEKKKVAAVNVDVSSLSLSDNEGNLLKESERKKVDALDVDTSHIQLVPEEPVSPEK